MKKLLLTIGMGFFATISFGQIILAVEAPAAIAGNVTPFTYADNWGADLTDPANAVLDTLVLVDDGTSSDSLGCNNLTNGAAMAGNIALIYRGTCEFGKKALEAQEAGAIGAIIINNTPDAPIPMGAGADGVNVTIPVAMISAAQGAIFRQRMAMGDDVRVFLGNKAEFFANDMGLYQDDVLRSPLSAVPTTLVQTGADHPIDLGAIVRNYGTSAQTGVTVTAKVKRGATEIYTNTSTSFDLDAYGGADDTIFVTFPTFSPATYTAGEHTIEYTINSPVTDQYPADNVNITMFNVNADELAIGKVNAAGDPVSNAHYQPAEFANTFSECMHFRHANASDIVAEGVSFTATTTTGGDLDGFQIVPTVFEWNDNFTNFDDLTDVQAQTPTLNPIATNEDYYITGNPQNTPLYIPFTTPVQLEDNQRYLICIRTFNEEIFLGFSSEVSYIQNLDHYLQPIHPIENDGTFAVNGFQGNPVPTLVLRTSASANSSINENLVEASSFPNPAKDMVTVKVNAAGNAKLTITDLAGRTVASDNVVIAEGKFRTSVSGMNAGTYVFNLTYDNGTSSQFKVVVTK